jgi:hypothetical protein
VVHYKLFFKINDHLAHLRGNKPTQLLAHIHGLPLLGLPLYLLSLLVLVVGLL